jgi:uncharacterized small protein (DUF1192 family)
LPLYTKADIEAEIAALKAKIHKAEDRQEYTSGGPGANAHERRGDLRAMYDRLAKLEAEWERLDRVESSDSTSFAEFPGVT